MKINVTKVLEEIIMMHASDLHLSVSSSPFIRVEGVLKPLSDIEPLTVDDLEYSLSQLMDEQQREIFDINKEFDFSVALGVKARVRVNAFFQKGYPAVAMRIIPMVVPKLQTLNLPESIGLMCNLKQGLILVVGPTGHGKSTSIASMIDKINEERAEHIVTVEDPIEYVFTNKKSLIAQREMYLDTHSWEVALKSVLRQDPNVVMVGEMRDAETMSAALQISETGHLVFATLHTNSAAQTIDRIISSFPEEKQSEIRLQLASVIEVVISQRLLPGRDGALIPAVELMLGSEAVRSLVREGKTHMIDNVINTSAQTGMISLDRSLADLVNKGLANFEEAIKYTSDPETLKRLTKRG